MTTPYQTIDRVARKVGAPCLRINLAASSGEPVHGWLIESRPVERDDHHRLALAEYRRELLYRAVPVDTDAVRYVLCDIVCGRLIVEWAHEDLERVRKRTRSAYGYGPDGPPTAILRVRGHPPIEGRRLRLSDWTQDTLEVVESDRPIELPWDDHGHTDSDDHDHTEKETDVSTAQVERSEETTDGWTEWMTRSSLTDVVGVTGPSLYNAVKEGRLCMGWQVEARPVTDADKDRELHPNTTSLYRARKVEEDDGSGRVDLLAEALKKARRESAQLREEKERLQAELEEAHNINVEQPEHIGDLRPIAVALGVPPTEKLIVQRIEELEEIHDERDKWRDQAGAVNDVVTNHPLASLAVEANATRESLQQWVGVILDLAQEEIEQARTKATHADEAVAEFQKHDEWDGPVTSSYDLQGAVSGVTHQVKAQAELLNRIMRITQVSNREAAVEHVEGWFNEADAVLEERDKFREKHAHTKERIAELEEQLAQTNMASMSTPPTAFAKSAVIDAAWAVVLTYLGTHSIEEREETISALAEALRESHRGAA